MVLGHWLVTAVLPAPGGVLAGLDVDSPLRHLPGLTPLSWLLQTLGLFFFAGGFGAGMSRSRSTTPLPSWWWAKVSRLLVATVVVLLGWVAVLGVLAAFGLGADTASTVANLVTSPLWFLAVYVVLLAGTGLARALDRRLGYAAAAVPAGLALLVEAAVAAGAPAVVGQLTVLLVWWVPWQLGVAAAERGLPGRWPALGLLVLGVAAVAVFVTVAGYPAAAVGGTGAARSNIAPPSPVALGLAVAQLGAVLLAAPLLRRLAGRKAVAWVNERALPIFLLHQSALVTVTLAGGAAGVLAGLHTAPTGVGWVLARLAWLLAFAAVLWILLLSLRRVLEIKSTTSTHNRA